MQAFSNSFSTTKKIIEYDPQIISKLFKQSNNIGDKFQSILFLPVGENRKGEGGLRTKGYFKSGGLINENELNIEYVPIHSEYRNTLHEIQKVCNAKNNSTNKGSFKCKPLITIITVVLNGQDYLEETILSVINQTYYNVEYIVIDGGSTDCTLEIIKNYENAIDYWVSENDKGIYDAMNKGISLSSGSIIGILNSDDLLYNTDTLENIIDTYLLKNGDVIYGDILLVNPRTKLVKEKRFAKIRKMAYGMYLNHPAIFISLSIYKRFGIFRSDIFKMAADYDLMLRILKEKVRFININKYLAVMRDGGVSIKSYDITIKETYLARKLNLSYIKFNLTNIVKCIKKYLT